MSRSKRGLRLIKKRNKIERKTKTEYNKLKLTSEPDLRARETPTLRNSKKDKTTLKLRRCSVDLLTPTPQKLKGRSLIRVLTCAVVKPVRKQEWLAT